MMNPIAPAEKNSGGNSSPGVLQAIPNQVNYTSYGNNYTTKEPVHSLYIFKDKAINVSTIELATKLGVADLC